LDPFAYGIAENLSLLLRCFVAALGLLAVDQGNSLGLLALFAMEGGITGKGMDLLLVERAREKRAAAQKAKDSKPGNGPGPGPTALAVLLLAFLVSSCGTGVTKQFVIDSQQAVLATASQYFVGCSMVTVAPAFSVDWNQNLTYGGGMFAGCTDSSNLVEFRCQGDLDQTGKTSIKCEPLKLWMPAPEVTQ
jgi:hypothetical protein